jgi:hypothetical protein
MEESIVNPIHNSEETNSGAAGRCTIAAPSAGLSLVGLRARRARLCFTRRQDRTQAGPGRQEQAVVEPEWPA